MQLQANYHLTRKTCMIKNHMNMIKITWTRNPLINMLNICMNSYIFPSLHNRRSAAILDLVYWLLAGELEG